LNFVAVANFCCATLSCVVAGLANSCATNVSMLIDQDSVAQLVSSTFGMVKM